MSEVMGFEYFYKNPDEEPGRVASCMPVIGHDENITGERAP
jgi:hypothetical protein